MPSSSGHSCKQKRPTQRTPKQYGLPCSNLECVRVPLRRRINNRCLACTKRARCSLSSGRCRTINSVGFYTNSALPFEPDCKGDGELGVKLFGKACCE